MERGFLHPAGELNDRPFRETFFLAGRPISRDDIPAVIDALDSVIASREPDTPPGPWEGLGIEEDRDTQPHEMIWEATDVPAFLQELEPRFLEGSKQEVVRACMPRIRLGFLSEEEAPFGVLLGKADVDPSNLADGRNLDIDLLRLSDTLRYVVDSVLSDAGVDQWTTTDPFDPFVYGRPFSIFHGLLEFQEEELARLREICDRLRRDEAKSLEDEGELRHELREAVGFKPTRSSSNHASHVIFAGNIHYHVEPSHGRMDHPNHGLATLRLEWGSTTGSVDKTRADPTGRLPHPGSRESEAASVEGLLGLVVTRAWMRQMVEEAWELLRDLEHLRTELECQPPEDITALDRISALGYRVSRSRRNLSWAMYHDLRGLEALSSDEDRTSLEYGLPPPWWSEDRPWEGRDTRFIRHAARTTLGLLNHMEGLTTEASEQIVLLSRQVESRLSIRYAAAMEGHNRWTKGLTVVIAVLTVVLVALTGALLWYTLVGTS